MVSLSCSVDQDFSWSGRRMHRATVSQKNTAAWTVFSSLPAFSRRVPRCPGFISSMRRIYPDKRYPCVFQKSGIFGQNPQFHNQESIGKIIRSFEMGFLPMGKKKKKTKKKTSQCLVTATPILLTIIQSRSMTSTEDSSSLNADLSELPTMWLWMPLCVPLWNTIFETVANFLDIKFPLPLLRTSLVPIFGQRLHI